MQPPPRASKASRVLAGTAVSGAAHSPAGLKGCTWRRTATLFDRLARHRNGIMRVSSAARAGAVSIARRRLRHRRAGRGGAAAVTALPL